MCMSSVVCSVCIQGKGSSHTMSYTTHQLYICHHSLSLSLSLSLFLSHRQALLLTSFYWGYMLTQLIGNRLSERYGGGVVMYFSGMVWSLGVACVSYSAYVSISFAVIIRILIGMAQGESV